MEHSTVRPSAQPGEWKKSACILCECNCGIEIKLAGDGRRFEQIRGDRDHPGSAGYACEKPRRLDHYQNGRHRLTSPLRRRPDGSYEEIGWETAIREIAARLAQIRDRHGGDKLFFYGGGGQGNHLGGAYARALMAAIGVRYQSNALAQEKTGEGLVDAILYGGHTKGDFEHAQVSVFIGKNPWQSHGVERARPTLREIAADPGRSMIVLDPRRTETAALADIHLQVRPGTDAWCLAAMLGVLVQEDLVDHDWLARHTHGADQVLAELSLIPVTEFAECCGVDEDLIREAARRIGAADSVATYEDLGIQQSPHSTLASYLNKLLWILTGNFAKPGGMHLHSWFIPLVGPLHIAKAQPAARRGDRARRLAAGARRRVGRALLARGSGSLLAVLPSLAARPALARNVNSAARLASRAFFADIGPEQAAEITRRLQFDFEPVTISADVPITREHFETAVARTPVTRAPVLGGLIPGSSVVEEILTDHPARFRAMWIDSSNPAHSLPDSPRFREALDALDLVVVVDVAFTETARCADYVLPASSQFEKWEATLFTLEFPRNTFHLRAPVVDPLPGTRPEPDIYAALISELGVVDPKLIARLRHAATIGRETYALAFFAALGADPDLMGVATYLLYETLGPSLPEGHAPAAVAWAMAQNCAISQPEAVARAGFTGRGTEPGERLFEAVLAGRSGVTFTVDEYANAWDYVRHPDRRFILPIPMLLDELRGLSGSRPNWTSDEFPFVLSAGERRAFTANTIIRDPAWRRRDAHGALHISPADAERLNLTSGSLVRVTTERGSAEAIVEITDTHQPGHISLPNGFGLDHPDDHSTRTGTAPNELTSVHRRDPFTGTPWHKNVPARLEPLR